LKNKKSHKISFKSELNYDLLGISSSEADYKLCWQINQFLNYDFKRVSDIVIFDEKNKQEQFFTLFKYKTIEMPILFLANKSEKAYFIDELKMIDFFLIIYRNNDNLDFYKRLKERIKNIPGINGVFKIDVLGLKSKNIKYFESLE
jgi:hypothetical protein